jgi:hypothetical protein
VIREGTASIRSQAKAILAACARDEEEQAVGWTRALLQTQRPDGVFPEEVNPESGEEVDEIGYDLETQMWVVLALARVMAVYPANRYAEDITGQLNDLVAFLEGDHLQTIMALPTTGLIVFDGEASTRVNLLAYFAFKAAGELTRAADLADDIMAKLWTPAEGRVVAGADEDAPFDLDQLLVESLAPAFLVDIGKVELAKLAELWQQYYVSGSGRALGLAETAIGLEVQGDWDATPTALDAGTTLEAIISKLALGDRASARAALAALEPATGLSPDALAMICIVSEPQGVFSLGSPTPLWTEGSVVDDRSQTFTYRFLAPGPSSDGRFSFPVNMNSEDAVVRLKSLGALPFGALSAEIEGFFTARASKV